MFLLKKSQYIKVYIVLNCRRQQNLQRPTSSLHLVRTLAPLLLASFFSATYRSMSPNKILLGFSWVLTSYLSPYKSLMIVGAQFMPMLTSEPELMLKKLFRSSKGRSCSATELSLLRTLTPLMLEAPVMSLLNRRDIPPNTAKSLLARHARHHTC